MSLLSRLAVQAARAYGMLVAGSANNVSADYLVVAGGGGGGAYEGAGGGAGGFLTSTATLSTLNTYSITVGAGGISAGSTSGAGNNGSNSVISGTGLTTITSIGGGGGGGLASQAGKNGGSGGGASSNSTTVGLATSGQGNNGGLGTGVPGAGTGGGGGGAGEAGNTDGPSYGGDGLASSISGTSTYYAGGGAGYSGSGAQGGLGGGGNISTPGTANTGGGGGAWDGATPAGNGGSGIVIISYTSATPKFVGGTITTSGGKQIHTFTSSGTLSPITPITANFLVVAGGGGAGDDLGGAGGAGGFRTSAGTSGGGGSAESALTLYSGATYVVTVGAGGAGATSGGANGTNGGNSSIAGTGITTLTSVGGGGGAGDGSGGGIGTAQSGGSGGGAASGSGYAGGAGTANQGYAGGTNPGGTYYGASAGGGGAGAAGTGRSGSSATGGNGGNGVQSSISGTATYYAGGGSGGTGTSGTSGTPGLGGGGQGRTYAGSTVKGGNGQANTGGGGGGGTSAGGDGGDGGSGIVIISYAGSQQFNGGLVTTSGGNTIHTFTSTGALTPLTNNLNNSLRFRNSASASITRTPTVAGNRRTFTWSAWVKRGLINAGTSPHQFLFSASTSTTFSAIDLYSNNIRVNFGNGTYLLVTNQVFRDPSAWYHIVLSVDTTQATDANRVKLYINGNQASFASGTYPTQNYDTSYNNTVAHRFGVNDASDYFDGYLADFNFIDGQALEPYYFGNNDANGVWKPIQYKGTYGTNGFYLTFGNTTSTTTLGYDSSPNGNNWTCNNISLTAGTTYDAMTDVPTNTSATVANYCVLNATAPYGSSLTLSQGNLRTTCAGAYWASLPGTFLIPSTGKWYWEVTPVVATNMPYDSNIAIGITKNISTQYNTGQDQWPGYTTESYGVTNDVSSMYKWTNVTPVAYGSSYTISDVIGVGLDMDAGTLTYYKNGVSQGVAFSGLTGNFVPSLGVNNTGTSAAINFGQRPFAYTPPTGFVALNTFNLPTPTILQGNKYMDATLWTGNGPASQVIVNQGQFKPDMVWVKNRSSTRKHNLYDSVRGVAVGASYRLVPDDTAAQDNPMYGVTSMNSNGFTIGEEGDVNANGLTFVGWQWQAGQGSTSSNTNGSITSTVSVNTTAGFSIVTYTGTGANATVGHGLGVAPSMVIVKSRTTAENWMVYHTVTGATQYIYLDSNGAAVTLSTIWNNTAPTSSVFSIGTNVTVNQSSTNYVAYCWAEISGFSKFGSFIGNSSTNGPFVYCGFRPRYILFKNTTSYDWHIFDAARNTYNLTNSSLKADTTGAEYTNNDVSIDLLSNGFKLRGTDLAINGPSNTIIFAAFAEHPFKNANAR